MSLAIIDAREWQKVVDLKTGEPSSTKGPLIESVGDLLRNHPYPGDLDRNCNAWVTDAALDLAERYRPELVFLCYAQLFFAGRFEPKTDQERAEDVERLFAEVLRFSRQSGFETVVIGTGRTVALKGEIDVSDLDGLALTTHGSARYAGLHQATSADLARLAEMPEVDRVVTGEEWLELFGNPDHDPSTIPGHLLVAKEGWTFKTSGIHLRKPLRVAGAGFELPLAAAIGNAPSLTDIRRLIEQRLGRDKIAVVVLEGVGLDEFPIANKPCTNGVDWFYHEPGESLYLTLSSGRNRPFDYPTGHKYFQDDEQQQDYPYSGYFTSLPRGTLGQDFSGRSIAVGNHSMVTHMVFGADVAVECFARNLFNQGCIAAIHRQDKYKKEL